MLKITLLLVCVSAASVLACKDWVACEQNYPKAYCTGIWKSWMKLNCAKFCGHCGTTGGGTVSGGQCGKVKVATSRVIGGTTATPGAWPWQIAMYFNNQFGCGGSLVNKDWVVTAAHCVAGRPSYLFKVVVGDHNRQVVEGSEQVFFVSQIIVHPNYDNKQGNNDIALMKLSKPVKFSNKVQPVCLPAQGEKPRDGSQCYITGWGKMQHPGRSVNLLQELKLNLQSNFNCATKNSWIYPVTQNMICASNPRVFQNQGGCHGDSGGPFVCKKPDGSWTLQGAVSWGSPNCNSKSAYTVFARIGQFRRWIDLYI